MARFTVVLIRSQSFGFVVPARREGDIVYLAIYKIFPQHKTHARYLVYIYVLGGEPQGNGSARILHEANGKLKQCTSDPPIMLYSYCAMCHPTSPKAAFNMHAIAVLNTNQSAYKPKKLKQRCNVARSQKKHTPATQRWLRSRLGKTIQDKNTCVIHIFAGY